MNKVEHEARYQQISLNSLSNQIFKNFVEWDMLSPKAGMIPVAKRIVSELFSRLSKEEVIKLADQVGKDIMSDLVLFMKNKIDLDSFLSWLELWLKKNSTAGFIHNVENNNIHTCIMRHDLGENWSLYHKIVLELIFKETLKIPVQINTTNSTLTFSFEGS